MRRFQTMVAVGLLLGAPQALLAQEPAEEPEAAERAEAVQEVEAAERARALEEKAHERALRAHERAEARHERAVREQERVVRALGGSGGYLGVALRDVTSDDVGRFGLPGERGALIESVTEESPAEKAGFQESDVVTSWNGQEVESVAALGRLVRETPPGRNVEIGMVRDGSRLTIPVELGDRSSMAKALAYRIGPEMRVRMEEARLKMGEAREHLREYRERLRKCVIEVEGDGQGRRIVIAHAGRGRMGVQLQNLTEQLGEYFGVEGGALVASVREESPAAAAGMLAGDVIVRIGAETVSRTGDVARAVREAEAGPVEVDVVRGGQARSLTVTLPERGTDGCEDVFVAPEGEGPHSHGLHVRPIAPHPPAATS